MARNKRITFLADLTKGYPCVLDIGTDHGLVLKKAFDQGYIQHAIASDINEEPLNQAKRNLKNYPVHYVTSDGFLAINKPYDLVIIAGMGAYLICDILEHAPKDDVDYILQANDKIEILRKYLMDNQFMITDEYVIHDKFHYVILKVKRGFMELSLDELYLGPILKGKDEAKPYYQIKANQIEKILPQADPKRQEELLKMLKIYKNF
ncbi:MAG: class I SAM-dependent methyltransferase [Acholeplasmataceae bacterium]|jgi:tRNA (adenine22-N1)-methyltransferase|nr:class I SAM-dependent methyltransferase [Acholeplasmataceae bacterium]